MAVESVKSRTFRALLDNGTTTSGGVKTINQSMGQLSANASDWDADKAFAIASKLSPCLSKAIYEVNDVATYKITAS